jgi:hypothetical protein
LKDISAENRRYYAVVFSELSPHYPVVLITLQNPRGSDPKREEEIQTSVNIEHTKKVFAAVCILTVALDSPNSVILHHRTPTTMVTKCKLSDLTTQETGMFLQMVEDFKQKLSREDEDEKVFIASLNYAATKIAKVQVCALLPVISGTWH